MRAYPPGLCSVIDIQDIMPETNQAISLCSRDTGRQTSENKTINEISIRNTLYIPTHISIQQQSKSGWRFCMWLHFHSQCGSSRKIETNSCCLIIRLHNSFFPTPAPFDSLLIRAYWQWRSSASRFQWSQSASTISPGRWQSAAPANFQPESSDSRLSEDTGTAEAESQQWTCTLFTH